MPRPTVAFNIVGALNSSRGARALHRIRQTPDFEGIKMQKGRSVKHLKKTRLDF